MKAFILTAGLGTRLRPLTNECAKPALPVIGIPTFWYSAWHLNEILGIKEIALNLSHKPESIKAAALDPRLCKMTNIKFHFSDETNEILGSSGALKKLGSQWIGGDSLAVCNGDSICFPNWTKMIEAHKKTRAAITLHVRRFKDSMEPYTSISVANDGRITAFHPKATSGMMFSGSYLFEPYLLERLPPGISELRPSLLEPLLNEGKLYAYVEDTAWFDTGSVATYVQAQFELIKKLPQTRKLIEMKMKELAPECWVPREWDADHAPGLVAPAIICGEQKEWVSISKKFGPRFIGLKASNKPEQCPTTDALVFGSHIECI